MIRNFESIIHSNIHDLLLYVYNLKFRKLGYDNCNIYANYI